MIDATEALYGPYRWERYDLLVLPPSSSFGGMENSRLTFATPTLLAGDRSLVSLVAHELAQPTGSRPAAVARLEPLDLGGQGQCMTVLRAAGPDRARRSM